jgi:hypothetical protein
VVFFNSASVFRTAKIQKFQIRKYKAGFLLLEKYDSLSQKGLNSPKG